MAKFFRILAFIPALALVAGLAPEAQMRVVPIDEYQGHVALGLALRHLANTGIFMMATAHPDDENNGLLVELSRGQGYRTTLATATRGNGGQNEIGPELGEPLGVLRTEELTALHRFDGVEQYFTRAVDFGYTIDIDENLKQWGRDEIIGDYVRLIRTIRPDVISAQSPTAVGPGQHANHALAAILSHEAYKVAGDPTKYPEQIQQGLRPWQPKKFYFAAGGFGGGTQAAAAARTCRVDLALYDSLLGRSYSEIGSEARSMHKCQGMAQLLALPAPSNSAFQLAETTIAGEMNKDEKALFDGVDTSVAALAQFAGQRPPRDLNDGLGNVQSSIQAAQKKFDTEGDAAALQPLLAGLRAARATRGQLRSMQIDAAGRDEIDFRLRQKEREFQQAALAAANIEVDALADDGIVVPGQPVRVNVIVANHGSIAVNVGQIRFDGFAASAPCALDLATAAAGRGGPGPGGRGGAGRGGTAPAAGTAPVSMLGAGQIARCTAALTIPANARVTEPYWHRIAGSGRYVFDADAPFGLPFRPTPFYMQASLSFGNDEVIDGMPIQYRYDGPMLAGEKRGELLVVPAMSVRVSPGIALIPASPVAPAPVVPTAARGRAAAPAPAAAQGGRGRAAVPARPVATLPDRDIRVTVVNDTKGPAEGVVKLELPDGWTSTPPEESLKFAREDESRTVRFSVHAPTTAKVGDYHVKASVTENGATYNRGYEVIEYPHIRRAHFYDDADVDVKVLDVRTAPNLTVGYVMGSGDEVAGFIEQLGAKVEMLDADALAWGDLSRYKTIVLGVRAYERREDLRANNARLLEYVQNGGTLLVQYNRAVVRDIDGPYPAQVSDNRVTDEHAPVKVLLPDHPVFNTPNKIRDTVWDDWVQERGLNFLGDKDSRYRDLVEMTDSFANNPGDKRGALVEATYGKGRWMYIGLGLWRELPAGVNGSYQLLANLISLGSNRNHVTVRLLTRSKFSRSKPSGSEYAMGSMTDPQIEHLLRRAGFGARADELALFRSMSVSQAVDYLVNYDQVPDDVDSKISQAGYLGVNTTNGAFAPQSNISDARQRWVFRMVHTNRPLQEKMTLFWHNHFATGYTKIAGATNAAEGARYMAAKASEDPAQVRGQLEMLRESALGNFQDILVAIAKDTAMLFWLDGRTNTKAAPQENFGREVMELFSMGYGNYTEPDVYAAARVFTGWNLQRPGTAADGTQHYEFVYNAVQHDTASKTFSFPIYASGDTTIPARAASAGLQDGMDFLAALAASLNTATYLATKLYHFFISEAGDANPDWVSQIAAVYLSSRYDMSAVMRAVLNTPEFWDPNNYYTRYSWPAEFVVRAMKDVGWNGFTAFNALTPLANMGQILYDPPNVSGWALGQSWFSSGAMLSRMNFASTLAANQKFNLATTAKTYAQTPNSLLAWMLDAIETAPMDSSVTSQLLNYLAATGPWTASTTQLQAKVPGLVHLVAGSSEYQLI